MIPITHVLQSIDECAQCDLKLVMLRNRKIFGHSHASEGAASTRGSTMWKNEKSFLSEKKIRKSIFGLVHILYCISNSVRKYVQYLEMP